MSNEEPGGEAIKVAGKKERPRWLKPLQDLRSYPHVVAIDDYASLSTVFVGMTTNPKGFTRVYVPWYDVAEAGFEPHMLRSVGFVASIREELIAAVEKNCEHN